ncbi:ORF135 [Spodoptera eridania nucleopolyhedrovirus]|uniref:ORF135 n=1 Tax=Spodoptera eridania nucleopolyhedrovirus TaxID=2315721 RepID=A0A346TQ68_9ABAC|nr:ORF135 [Spodoptera eridania nucleopolyhedrovirus]AXU41728.1 ORF135 [Spodoptera eridania nucleopolyhedrovirus]
MIAFKPSLKKIKCFKNFLITRIFDSIMPHVYIVSVDGHFNIISIHKAMDFEAAKRGNLPDFLRYYNVETKVFPEKKMYIFRCINESMQ